MPVIATRPGVVTFVAIVLIVLGSLALLLGLCGVLGQAMISMIPEPAGEPRPDDIMGNIGKALGAARALEKEVPGYMAMQIISILMLFGVGLVQLIAGIGCLRLNPSARKTTLIATALYFVFAMGSLVYHGLFVLPANVAFQKAHQAPGMPDMSGSTQIMGALGMGCNAAFYITIAVLIFAGLNTQSAKIAFGIAKAKTPAEDDREFPDDREPQHGIKEGDPRSRHEGYEEHDE